MVHNWTDSVVLLSHVNIDLKLNKCDHIAYILSRQYNTMRKNASADSEFLLADDLAKRIMKVTANKNLFSTSKTFF